VNSYRPKHFILQELVPPDIYHARGESAWELLDPRALVTADTVRDTFGPTTINNWHAGGRFRESGLRSFSSPTGAKLSQHRFGRGNDCKFRLATPQEAYEYILLHAEKFPYLTTLEDITHTASWLHFDVRLSSGNRIRIVKP